MGLAAGAARGAIDYQIEEMKAAQQEKRDILLSRLRGEEAKRAADLEIENMPKRGAAQTKIDVERAQAMAPVNLKSKEDEARQGERLAQEFSGGIIERERARAKAVSEVQGAQSRETQSHADELARKREAEKVTITEDGQGRKWRVDAKGNVLGPVEVVHREGGRELAREQMSGRSKEKEQRTDEDRIKAIEREREALLKKDFLQPADSTRLEELNQALVRLDPKYAAALGIRSKAAPAGAPAGGPRMPSVFRKPEAA